MLPNFGAFENQRFQQTGPFRIESRGTERVYGRNVTVRERAFESEHVNVNAKRTTVVATIRRCPRFDGHRIQTEIVVG